MLVQATPTATTPEVVQVTGVKINPTPQGAEVILETSSGEQLQVLTSSYGRTFVANIVNIQLALPEKKAFRALDPATGITAITVTQQTASSIRVSVTGKTAVPTARVIQNEDTLALSLSAPVDTTAQPPQPPPTVSETVQPETSAKPGETIPAPVEPQQPAESAPGEEEIEIVVTGEREDGYSVSNATVGTRTDTPLRDIPQSIQVIPQEVIQDQQATRLTEVLKNAPGVVIGSRSPRDPLNIFKIRGFDTFGDILINGLPDPTSSDIGFGSNIERVEVLKGPASVLFGQGGLAGTVNLVTKQPLANPFYFVEASAGSYNFYRGAIDLSGPLNDSKTVLYHLNASAQTTESFIDFYGLRQYLIAPVLAFELSDRTKLTLAAEYALAEGTYDFGIPPQGSVLPNPNGKIPRNRFVSEPDFNHTSNEVFRISYDFEHRFSDAWQVRSVFRTSLFRLRRDTVFPLALESDGRTLEDV